MYENPKLNRVGDVDEVVLGITSFGEDMCGNWVNNPFEFAPETDLNEE